MGSTRTASLKSGRYTLLRTLGSGSQAETFEARDGGAVPERPVAGALVDEWQRYVERARRGATPNPHGLVAIKCFHVGRAKAWKDVELAEREARTLAALAHPNLPRYIEHFEEDGALYLVMEMVEGESLATLRARHRTSSVAEVTRMVRDIGEALRYLHGRAPPVVHRDIKPGNIIRRSDGSFALVDFGAVRDRLKPEGGSTVVGTFGYMAPEQFQGRASPRSDLYGLAATALVMLTGREPEDLPHVGLGIDVASALPGSTPASLVRALTSMLSPDPDRRAASIEEALALLDAPRVPHAPVTTARSVPESERESRPRDQRKKESRAARDARKREARTAKRARRAAARARRAPLVPRLLGQLGLAVALLAVWLGAGLVAPLVLVILSLVFGGTLRRAARSSTRAAGRAQEKLRRASGWLSGEREGEGEGEGEAERVRVAAGDARVRVVDVRDGADGDFDPGDELEAKTPTKPARRARRS